MVSYVDAGNLDGFNVLGVEDVFVSEVVVSEMRQQVRLYVNVDGIFFHGD